MRGVIADHLGLVHSVARRRFSNDPAIELADLVGEGSLGLLAAGRTFDRARGTPFARYATRRIRSAISELFRHQRSFGAVGIRSDSHESLRSDGLSPLDVLLEAERARRVRDAVAGLPAKERAVIAGLFWREETGVTIAAALGVTTGRVSQLRTQALHRLAETLSEVAHAA